jgi:hypothetical protein
MSINSFRELIHIFYLIILSKLFLFIIKFILDQDIFIVISHHPLISMCMCIAPLVLNLKKNSN